MVQQTDCMKAEDEPEDFTNDAIDDVGISHVGLLHFNLA